MASNTGFAALAQTSRDAALALAAREEELARLREALAEQTRMVQHASAVMRAVWEDEVRRVVDIAEFDNRRNLRRISRLEAELAATRAELAEVRAAAVLDPE